MEQKIAPHLWFDKEAKEEQTARVTEAFLKMKKFDLATLQRAYDGK